MLRMIAFVLSSAAMMLSSAAYAQASSAPQAPTATTESKAKRVCKSDPVIGSRFVKKICHTQAEWDAIQKNDRSMVDGYQRQACRSGAGSSSGNIQC
jgi:hypothetical protein